MMKYILNICLMTLVLAANANAENSSLAGKIALVDVQEVTTKSEIGKNAAKLLQKKASQYQADADKMQKEIQKLDKELSGQKSILSEKAFDAKVQKRNERFVQVNKDVQEKRYNFDKVKHEIDSEIMEHVFKIIEEIAAEKKYDLVLLKTPSNVLYSSDKLVIDSEVLKRLNKKASKTSVKF